MSYLSSQLIDGKRYVTRVDDESVARCECGELLDPDNAPATVTVVFSGLTICGCAVLPSDLYAVSGSKPDGSYLLTKVQNIYPPRYQLQNAFESTDDYFAACGPPADGCEIDAGTYTVSVDIRFVTVFVNNVLRGRVEVEDNASAQYPRYYAGNTALTDPCNGLTLPMEDCIECETNNIGGGTVTVIW